MTKKSKRGSLRPSGRAPSQQASSSGGRHTCIRRRRRRSHRRHTKAPEKTDKKPRGRTGSRERDTRASCTQGGQGAPVLAPRLRGIFHRATRCHHRLARRGRSGSSREQYIRMRVRARGDRLSIVDSHLVDGPLGQAPGILRSERLRGHLDDRLLHAGSLPDLGVQRSFVNPDGPAFKAWPPLHRAADVRVHGSGAGRRGNPRHHRADRVRLHRVKEEARSKQLGDNAAGPAIRARSTSGRRARRPARLGSAGGHRRTRWAHTKHLM